MSTEVIHQRVLELDRTAALTEIALADGFAKRCQAEVLFCPPWKTWLIWTGQRWQRDESGQVMERAKEMARALERFVRDNFRRDEEDADGGKVRNRKLAEARAFQSERKLTALLKLARSSPALLISPGHLDAKPMLLNTPTATVDLSTGEARAPDPGDRLTQLTGCTWPDAGLNAPDPPRYLRMLNDIFAGSAEMVAYFQRLLGYSFTGSTRERVMAILFGKTMNGKSTLEGLNRRIAGDYCATTRPATFMGSVFENEGRKAALAGLRGKRIVQMSESREGDRLDEAVVQGVTGGDEIETKRMGENPFTFRPSFKLWLATNHKPGVSSSDEAIWNRLHFIPFTRNIVEVMTARTEPVMGTEEAVESIFAEEGPLILAWIVRGCLEWQRDGLKPPPAVLNAGRVHRQEMDPLAPFLEECCEIGDKRAVRVTELRPSYFHWCRDNNYPPLPPKALDAAVAAKFQRRKTNGYDTWHGFGLRKAS